MKKKKKKKKERQTTFVVAGCVALVILIIGIVVLFVNASAYQPATETVYILPTQIPTSAPTPTPTSTPLPNATTLPSLVPTSDGPIYHRRLTISGVIVLWIFFALFLICGLAYSVWSCVIIAKRHSSPKPEVTTLFFNHLFFEPKKKKKNKQTNKQTNKRQTNKQQRLNTASIWEFSLSAAKLLHYMNLNQHYPDQLLPPPLNHKLNMLS